MDNAEVICVSPTRIENTRQTMKFRHMQERFPYARDFFPVLAARAKVAELGLVKFFQDGLQECEWSTDPRMEEYVSTFVSKDLDVSDWVLAFRLFRRHITDSGTAFLVYKDFMAQTPRGELAKSRLNAVKECMNKALSQVTGKALSTSNLADEAVFNSLVN